MSRTGESRCRFVLSEIDENLIRDEDAYSILEPRVTFEIDGKNAFQSFGISAVEKTVIMHSLENFLEKTLHMIKRLRLNPASAERYWFLGTGFGLGVHREGTVITILVEVDGHWGPVQKVTYPQSREVGKVTVREWVRAIVALAVELTELFKRLNPRIYAAMAEQENQIRELTDWLAS